MNNYLQLFKQILYIDVKKGLLDFYRFWVSIKLYIIDTFFTADIKNKNYEKKLLLIKMDELGDYILFRAFFKLIRNSLKYKDYKITIIGNIKWKDICRNLDSENYDDEIWVDKKLFTSSIKYRFEILRKVRIEKFDTILNPSSSRNFIIDDAIVRAAKAKNNIGFRSDGANTPLMLTFLGNYFYNELFKLPQNCYFEFYRYLFFFEKIKNMKIDINGTSILTKDEKNFSTQKFVIIAPGAGAKYRQWPVAKFAEICLYVKNKYKCEVKIIGGDSEKNLGKKILQLTKEVSVDDITGKTSLTELIDILSDSLLIIANDSGTAHLAAALGVKTIIISNGSRLGRFTPYPPELDNKNVSTIYPSLISNLLNSHRELVYEVFKYKSYLNIKKISTDIVKKTIDDMLLN